MATVSQLPDHLFSIGLFLFVVFTLQNLIAARFVNAPNSSLNISIIATVLTSFLLMILIFLAKFINILTAESYQFMFVTFALAANSIIFSVIFNVNLIKGTAIVLICYLLTAAVVSFTALVAVYSLGFNHYHEALKLLEPHLYELFDFFS